MCVNVFVLMHLVGWNQRQADFDGVPTTYPVVCLCGVFVCGVCVCVVCLCGVFVCVVFVWCVCVWCSVPGPSTFSQSLVVIVTPQPCSICQ